MIVVSGGIVSTTQVCVAGVESMLPDVSVAFTENVCEPSARLLYVVGVVHAVYAELSILHWNVLPVFVEWNANDAVFVFSTVPDGPESINVSGGVVSGIKYEVKTKSPLKGMDGLPVAAIPAAYGLPDT